MCEQQEAMYQDQHLQHLMEYAIQGWPDSKNQLPHDIRTYWTFRDDMAVIDRVVIKRQMHSNTESITATSTKTAKY